MTSDGDTQAETETDRPSVAPTPSAAQPRAVGSALPPPTGAMVPAPPALTTAPDTSPRHVAYRAWDRAFPAAVCQAVIDQFDDEVYAEASVQTHQGDLRVAPETRRASNVFIEPGHWTGALVTHYAYHANLVWNYDLSGLGTLSLVRYEPGGHFDWHVDVLARDQVEYPGLGRGLERKLSVTVNLSDPGDYGGGELELLDGIGQRLTRTELRGQGSVVVFPSTLGHRVTPITHGVRYALVGWIVGPPIR